MAAVQNYMFLIHISIKIGVIFSSDEKTCVTQVLNSLLQDKNQGKEFNRIRKA